jgi:hypothetical protein
VYHLCDEIWRSCDNAEIFDRRTIYNFSTNEVSSESLCSTIGIAERDRDSGGTKGESDRGSDQAGTHDPHMSEGSFHRY